MVICYMQHKLRNLAPWTKGTFHVEKLQILSGSDFYWNMFCDLRKQNFVELKKIILLILFVHGWHLTHYL